MKKLFSLVVLLSFTCFTLSAQDIITKTDGTDIETKVTEVSQSQVSYKKYSNLEGPTYIISVSDILMITYENGEREMYNIKSETTKSQSLPQGVMTFNDWSGKVSVGGVTIENEMLDMYFSPKDLELYSQGKSKRILGLVVGCVGAVPFGMSCGYYLAGGTREDQKYKKMLIGGGALFIGGLIIDGIGYNQIKRAISNYNHSNLAFQPDFHLFTTGTDIGIGISLVF